MTTTLEAPPTRRSLRSTTAPKGCPVIACWGHSASGKTTIALNLASALAKRKRVLLIDADTHSASIAQALSLTDYPTGLAPLSRIARLNRLNPDEFEKQTIKLKKGGKTFTLLPGINPVRWPEVTPQTFEQIIEYATRQFDLIIVDAASPLEQGLYAQNQPQERNAFTRWLVSRADTLIVTLLADPVSIARHLALESELQELRKQLPTQIVVNRFRKAPLGLDAKAQINMTLKQLTSRTIQTYLPDDQKACDQAMFRGAPLSRKSPLGKAINQLAQDKKLAG